MMKIYKVFRKRCEDKTNYILLAIALIFLLIIICFIKKDEYISFLSFIRGPVEIEAGEDLSKYYRCEVVCEVPYVLANVLDFYIYEREANVVESSGFVGLDQNLENPFLFGTEWGSHYGGAKILRDKTHAIVYEGKPKCDIGSLLVTGYVSKLEGENCIAYMNGLNAYYGEKRYDEETFEAYLISAPDSFWRIQEIGMAIKVFLLVIAIVFFAITFFFSTGMHIYMKLKKCMKKYHVNEFAMNRDFVHAWEADDNFWIGDDYTFFADRSSAMVFPNREIVWIYKEIDDRTLQDFLVFYTLDKRRYSKYVDKSMTECILSYYEKQYPRILVNQYNKELLHMFKNNYNVFLDLKYRQG